MKMLFVLLVMPLLSIGQTIHIKEEKIVYEGTEKIERLTASQIFNNIQKALPIVVDQYRMEDQSLGSIKAAGEMRLKAPYNIIRVVHYIIRLNANEEGYNYSIDDVSFTEQKRGEKPTTKSSKELLENMGETGKVASETEQILNEIDLQFQKLLNAIKEALNMK